VSTRKVRQARNRVVANRIILAVLVVVVAAALYGLVGVIRPVRLTSAAQAAQAGMLSVTTALIGCPAPGSGGQTGGGIAVANLPLQASGGKETFTELDPGSAGTSVGTATRPGQLTIETIKAAPAPAKKLLATTKMAGGAVPTGATRGGLVVSAAGANAQGLDVEQLGPGGQPTARCEPAGSDFWFVSPGGPTLHTYLYLLNPGNVAADASVGVQTDSGPLLGPQDSGILVPPHSMVVQDLDKLLHSAKAVALNVTTSTGTVVAAVRETTSTAKEGTWLPEAQEPATTQVLAGLPTVSGQRELYVTVPGNAAAQVKVTVITARGSYQPTGGSGINLLGHLTSGVSIPSLNGLAGAIEVSSNVPVVAALEVSGGPRGAPGAFMVGSSAIVGQAVVAASTSGRLGTTYLELSAPSKAASVRIVQAVPGSPLTGLTGQVISVPARSAVQVKLALPKRLAKDPLLAFVVTPLRGSGPVYAGRVAVIRGTVQTVLPVVSSPAQVQLGNVRQSLLAILGS
jgi:hypothetical protein